MDPVSIIEYGLYALVHTGRCTEEDIKPASEWLSRAKEEYPLRPTPVNNDGPWDKFDDVPFGTCVQVVSGKFHRVFER